jgi:hypothetical protein
MRDRARLNLPVRLEVRLLKLKRDAELRRLLESVVLWSSGLESNMLSNVVSGLQEKLETDARVLIDGTVSESDPGV